MRTRSALKPAEIRPLTATSLDLLAFIFSLSLAYVLGWSTKDLIWGLWLTSLLSGLSSFLIGFMRPVVRRGAHPVERLIFGAIGILGLSFFALHFGGFHYIYATMLHGLIPLEPQPNRVYLGHLSWTGTTPFSFFQSFTLALTNYWLFALVNMIHDYRQILEDRIDAETLGPYRSVLKLHILIMGLGLLWLIGIESFIVFTMVFALFYAPSWMWRSLFQLLSKKYATASPTSSPSAGERSNNSSRFSERQPK